MIQLPLRRDDGSLAFTPALLQKRMDTNSDYLPLTRANLLRQAFKFLGERYGWGHSYDARDCSGFVSDVYRSMGVQMPRNTRDQSLSAGLRHTAFAQPESYFHRYAALSDEEAVHVAGHVWDSINAPNLEQNIRPTRGRATLVLTKGDDHAVQRVRLRKL